MKIRYFLGIDIGKNTFHAALTVDGQNFIDQPVDNDPRCIKEYFEALKAKYLIEYDQLLVCMEHTGIYCYPVLDYLTKRKIKVFIEPALRIKQSQGMQRGKSDKNDSKRIAKYLFKNVEDLRCWRPKREVIQKLRALLVVRDRLIQAKSQFEVPIKESKEFVEASIRNLSAGCCKSAIAGIKKDLKKVDAEIKNLIK